MRPCKSKIQRFEDGSTRVTLDPMSKYYEDTVIAYCKQMFSKPLTEQECKLIMQTLVELQLCYSDDVAELEDYLFRTFATTCELFMRLKEGKSNGELLSSEAFDYFCPRLIARTIGARNSLGRNP